MKTFQENISDRQSIKATDWADTTTVLDSFEPQDDFQACVKSFQITCMEKIETMGNALMSGLSSLHRKMDSLSEKGPSKCDMISHPIYQQITFEKHNFQLQLEADKVRDKLPDKLTDKLPDKLLSLIIKYPYLPTYEESLEEKNDNENEHGKSNVHGTQTSDTPKTPQQGTLKNDMDVASKILDASTACIDSEENRPPEYDEIFCEENLETDTKKYEKAFECQKTGPTDSEENRPPPYDDIFCEENLETVTKKCEKAFERQKTGPTDSEEKEEDRPQAYDGNTCEENLETLTKKDEKAVERQKTGPTDSEEKEERRPQAYDGNTCEVNLETLTKKDKEAFECEITGLTDSEEKEEDRPQAYDGNTCEENLETLTKKDKEAFECQQTDLTDSDEKGENSTPAYDGILCEESLETVTKEDRDASFRETDNTSLREGPVYTNIFTDEMDTKEEDEHQKYNGNIHSTEENHELPKQSITLTDTENVYRNETSKMNNGFRKHKDKTMSEEDVSEFSKAMLSVGILYLPHCISTLFRAGTIYGITAAHIFARDKKVNEEDIGTLLRHKATKVDFGRFNQHRKFRLVEAVFIDEDLDIVILRFNDEDKHKLPPPLICSNHDISELVDEVALIGVGHRNNNLKVLEHDVKVIQKSRISEDQIRVYLQENYEDLKEMCIFKGVDMEALDESYKGMMSQHNIILNAYSGHGASGAPVLSKTNPVTVIGVFTSGYPKIIYNIPELFPLFPPRFTFECATNSSYIFGKVVKSHEDLAKDIFTEKME